MYKESISEEVKEIILNNRENFSHIYNNGCSRCGCTGVHACLGYPVIWTEEDKERLKQALSKMYSWEKSNE